MGKPGKARRVGDVTRAELLARLRDLVLSKGFAHTTMDQFAAAIGCSKSTLYGVSASKISLVATVLHDFLAEIEESLTKHLAELQDPAARVTGVITELGVLLRPMSADCFVDVLCHDRTAEVYIEHLAAILDELRADLADGVRAGRFRAADAGFLTAAVGLLAAGINSGELPRRTGLSPADSYARLAELVLATLTNTNYPELSEIGPGVSISATGPATGRG